MAQATRSAGGWPARAIHRRRGPSGRRNAAVTVMLGAWLMVGSAEAYLFFSDGRTSDYPGWAEHAMRWSADVWGPGETLVFEVARDPHFEVLFDSPEGTVPYVRRALASWSGLSTADLSLEVTGVSEKDEADPLAESPARDNRNTVFLDSSEFQHGGYSRIWSESSAGLWQITECDVALGDWAIKIRGGLVPEVIREVDREHWRFAALHDFFS